MDNRRQPALQEAKKLRLLVCAQALDLEDPYLGFFHKWLEEFAKHTERLEVIALRVGKHHLPRNVSAHPLGGAPRGAPPRGCARLAYRLRVAASFLVLIWRLRRRYDAVFVHMNPEYVVLGGPLWRGLGKPVGLWYAHGATPLSLRLALPFLAHAFTSTPQGFRLSFPSLHIVGQGIDTTFWTPDPAQRRGSHFLSAGRLDPVKRHDLAIREAAKEGVPIRIVGDGPERERLEKLAREIGAQAEFLGPLDPARLREEYRAAAKLIHRSETGSLDKVVLEAAACGCPVDTTNPELQGVPLTREWVEEHHALSRLIPRILKMMYS